MPISTPTRSLRSRLLVAAAAAVALALPTASVLAQAAYPNKPIRLIVPFPPGGGTDMIARTVAQKLADQNNWSVIVDNRPGAGGNLGVDATAKSAPDGYTLVMGQTSNLAINPSLYAKLPYDPIKDFAPIALVGSAPLVWAAPKPATPLTAAAFVKSAQAAGDKLAYGSVGAGSGGHLGMELLKESLKFDALHVPFAGGPAILNAMLGGQIQMTLLPNSTVAPMVQAGKLQAIAVTSAARSPLAPDLPSMDELGAKGINIEVWNAVMAPAKMPAAHQARLNAELGKILQTPDIQQKLFAQGWKVEDTSQAALAQRIQSDTTLYGALIAKKGIKLE